MQYIMYSGVTKHNIHSFIQEPVICPVTLGQAKPQLLINKNPEKYIYDKIRISEKLDNRCTGFSRQQFSLVVSLIFRLTEQFKVVCLSLDRKASLNLYQS